MPWRLQLQRRTLMNVRCFGGRIVKSNSSPSLKYIVKSASEQCFESEPSKNPCNSPQHALDAFYRFSRPHTIIGTALSIISVSLLAIEKLSDFSPLFFSGVLEAIVAALLMNIYIVGLNQISDIDIDKVNKPYLPLASGEYSVTTGVMIVSSFAILSFWLGWMVSSRPLLWALFVSFVLGTAYSLNSRKKISKNKELTELHDRSIQSPITRSSRGHVTYWYQRQGYGGFEDNPATIGSFRKSVQRRQRTFRSLHARTRLEEFSMTRSPDRSNARSNESNSNQYAGHSKARNDNSGTDNTQLFVHKLGNWSFCTLMARKTHYHGLQKV